MIETPREKGLSSLTEQKGIELLYIPSILVKHCKDARLSCVVGFFGTKNPACLVQSRRRVGSVSLSRQVLHAGCFAERQRERERVCVCERECERVRESVYVIMCACVCCVIVTS